MFVIDQVCPLFYGSPFITNDAIVIKTFEKELSSGGVDVLTPLKRIEAINGVAHPDEVNQVVMNRSGSILSASTILKSDFFSNLQKMTLPEYVLFLCLLVLSLLTPFQAH
jgi:hypothetical protein